MTRFEKIQYKLFTSRVKGGFKEVDLLSRATDEPVLSTPEIHGPLKIDSSHLFLLVRFLVLHHLSSGCGTVVEHKHCNQEVMGLNYYRCWFFILPLSFFPSFFIFLCKIKLSVLNQVPQGGESLLPTNHRRF